MQKFEPSYMLLRAMQEDLESKGLKYELHKFEDGYVAKLIRPEGLKPYLSLHIDILTGLTEEDLTEKLCRLSTLILGRKIDSIITKEKQSEDITFIIEELDYLYYMTSILHW